MTWSHHLIWTKTALPSMEASRAELGTVSPSSVKNVEPGDAVIILRANKQFCFVRHHYTQPLGKPTSSYFTMCILRFFLHDS